jgi:hypothetical protein
MIFILCFLLHIIMLCADTDELQNEQLLTNTQDNSSTHVSIKNKSVPQQDDILKTAKDEEIIPEDETTELEEVSESTDTISENNTPLIEAEIKNDTVSTNELSMEQIIEISASDNLENESRDEQVIAIALPENTTQHNLQKSSICMQTMPLTISQDIQKTKKVTVINSITPAKTAYKHWSGTYEPEFTVTVEGKPINMSCKETVELNATTMSISYHAQFPAQHSSEDSIVVNLEKSTRTIAVDFDWHATPRLCITQS